MDANIRETLSTLMQEMGQDSEGREGWLKLGWKLYDEGRLNDELQS